ncbi:MAG: M24 family metallopeptidase [Candidatus Thorarchaeota archaeon]
MSQAKPTRDILLGIIKEKHDQLPSIMKETKVSCWLTFIRETEANPDPITDLIIGGKVVWESAFIFNYQEDRISKVAVVGNFDAPAEREKGIWDKVIPYKEGIIEPLRQYFYEIDPQNIALNFSEDDVVSDGLSHGMFLKISNILADKKDRFISAAPIIRAIRGRKTETEIKLVTEACKLTEKINQRITSKLKVGLFEPEIQQMYHDEMDQLGVEEAWQRVSCPAIDAGPDKELGHVGPSSQYSTKKGHTLHNDFGIKLQGYCSDLQRMWFFGTEPPTELVHAFETVRDAILKAADFIKPGVEGYSVDNIAREYVKSRGYEEYAHALGHQVGTKAHDGGVILGPLWERYGDTPKGLVEQGNIFTLELNVKTKNYGTISLEENVVITKDGCKFLVPPQEKFILIT